MKTLKIIIQVLRRSLLGLLIAYWVIFICYTVEKFITGGSSSVVGWYGHIDASVLHRGDEWYLAKWSWETFLVKQLAILAITLSLHLFEQRSKRMPGNQDN